MTLRNELYMYFPSLNNDNASYNECMDKLAHTMRQDGGLSYCKLNQILHLFNEAGHSIGFYKYYFMYDNEINHIYPKENISGFSDSFTSEIKTEQQLLWGLRCFIVDALLLFGNVKSAYRELRGLELDDLKAYFKIKRIDTKRMEQRSASLDSEPISKDCRYFLSEIMSGYLKEKIKFCTKLEELRQIGQKNDSILKKLNKLKDVSSGDFFNISENRMLNDILLPNFGEDKIDDIDDFYECVLSVHNETHELGAANNRLYLSAVNELDIYVATSMRTREDFDNCYDFIKELSENKELVDYNLRIFDPTNCVAGNPFDKGLTECLMVKCAKVLVYLAGTSDSYGKDAEAAIAMSLGKPVIMLYETKEKADIYREKHPLTRLINIESGVACGAMITNKKSDVPILLKKIFDNELKYKLSFNLDENEILHLKDSVTKSCVRLQTSDKFLREAFWNNYHDVA